MLRRLNQPSCGCEAHQLHAAAHAKLAHDVFAETLYGPYAEIKLFGHLPVATALRDQAQDVYLARRELCNSRLS
jgi:hypothetical protein